MKKKIVTAGLVLFASLIIPISVFAQIGSPSSSFREQRLQQREAFAVSRADQEIERRINSLNILIARVQSIKKLSDNQKSGFIIQIQSEINSLTNLKAKIDSDTDTTTLAVDKKSILTEYRIYWLFIPKIRIVATADRILQISDDMTALLTKLQTLEGNTTDPIISDAKSKIADAKANAQSAIDIVINLIPDGGDTTKMASNTQALQSARQKIATAIKDLGTARFDIQKVRVILKSHTPLPTAS